MRVQHAKLLVVLAACRPIHFDEFPPECDESIQQCPPGGSSTTGSTGDDGGIQTVTGTPSTGASSTSSTASSGDPDPSSGGEPAVPPAIVSVALTPDPLTLAGAIAVDVLADGADGVRLAYPGAEVELTPDPEGHFRGQIEVHTGLTNGTHEATVTPWRGDLVGASETRPYTLALPAAGELFLWDTMPDHGLGEVVALRVTDSGHVIGLGTVYEGGTPRCFLHRRDLEGKYTEADDIRVIFPGKECQAIDLVVDGEELYLLVSMTSGDGPRWRVGTAKWGQDPTILRTGAKDETAYALARSPSGQTAICGTAPSPGMMEDKLDGRVWPLFGAPVELDYVAPEDPLKEGHQFDETLRDCAFAGERLIAVGDVFGWHEKNGQPPPPKRARPLLLELDDAAVPVWHVFGLGPGNITQGVISGVAVNTEGRYVTGLYSCTDVCDPQGEIRVYEPGGHLWWQVTLGPSILPPQDVAWSPAGYVVVASAEATGNWSSKFVLQAFIPGPGQYEPVWSFAKADVVSPHLARTVAVGAGVVVGGGVGGAGVPTLAFLRP